VLRFIRATAKDVGWDEDKFIKMTHVGKEWIASSHSRDFWRIPD